jgi:uncharacterized protein YjbI with pentapeptide repeats
MRPKKQKQSPKFPFSDEQIQAKAFEIWQSRGGSGGSAEEDWQKAIQQLKAELHPLRKLKRGTLSSGQAVWNWIGFKDKTFWNWLELLIVPLALAGGAFYLQETADQRDEQIAEDRANQAIFASYLDQMNTLLIEKGLRNAKPGSEVFILAQARTTTALRELDNNRRRLLLEFLIAANLNNPTAAFRENPNFPVNPNNTENKRDLLVGASLESIKLRNANLREANLSAANLRHTDLSAANLSAANLRHADLVLADLNNAVLSVASLRNANLNNTNLSNALLSDADLSNALLSDADLSNADLSDADLSNALLSDADLSNADLSNTNLSNANLSNANLSNAQLDRAFLCGTTLPNGSVSDRNCECLRERKCGSLGPLYPVYPND